MMRARWMFEGAAGLALLGAFWALSMVLLRPSPGVASPVATAPEAEMPAARPERLWAAADEIRDALRAQPDVAAAEVTLFTRPERLLVLVNVTWCTPTPPPQMRLDTIARWTRDRFGGDCDVHVVTPEHRAELVQR
jgi:hypothetical protein